MNVSRFICNISWRYLLIAALSLLSFFAHAEHRLLILDSQSGEPYDTAREAMLKELEFQGYSVGKNLTVRRHDIHNKVGLGLRLLQVENLRGYDVAFINGTIANQAAYEFGYDNPEHSFVFCSITDPVGVGLVEEMNVKPVANFTGVAFGLPIEERLRYLQEVLPEARTIGMIYAEMPQSLSYVAKLKEVIQQPEFSHLKVIFRPIPFVNSDLGHVRMLSLLESPVLELSPEVDLFMTPSDQLGIRQEFAQVVTSLTEKPLMGLSEKEVQEWGAHFGLYPVLEQSGTVAGRMVARILRGESVQNIIPIYPVGVFGVNLKQSEKVGLHYPDQLLTKTGMQVFE